MTTVYRCPACHGDAELLVRWPLSGLEGSVFNGEADFASCPNCGHVFIGSVDDNDLIKYYTEEAIYFSKAHFNVNAPENIEKYKIYKAVLDDNALSDRCVMDVGCGRGGFLQYLSAEGWRGSLMGVDVDAKSLPQQQSHGAGTSVVFHNGSATALPAAESSQDVLTAFHVFEHFHDLDRLMREVVRVLKPGGCLLIEVPDAERYGIHPYGIGYWLTIREHVQHFTASSLVRLLSAHGLTIRMVRQRDLPTPEFLYPSLMVLAQKSSQSSIQDELVTVGVPHAGDAFPRMCADAQRFDRLAEELGLLTFWGVSEEFFALIPLLKANSLRFCDKSQLKQGLLYRSQVIHDPMLLSVRGGLVITARIHAEQIRKDALAMGWPSDRIYTVT